MQALANPTPNKAMAAGCVAAYISMERDGLVAVGAAHVCVLLQPPQPGRQAGRRAAAASPGLLGHLRQAPGTRQQFGTPQGEYSSRQVSLPAQPHA